jgi:hypothetical protein
VKLVAPFVALLIAVAFLPALLAGGDQPTRSSCETSSGEPGPILVTIRTLESRGDYTARARGSTASGAYQFLDTSWDGYGGYPSAWLAPPSVQDAKAAEHVADILAAHHGDVAAVPVVWYIGHVPDTGSPAWDTVPYQSAGNTLTPRQYQARWLASYERITNGSPAGAMACTPAGSSEVVADGWALPGPRAVLDATADQLDDPHHDYPAWDWLIPGGNPIYAIRGGVVARVTT